MFSVQNRTVRYRELNPKKGRNFFVSHPKYDLKITIESREGDKDLGGGEGEGDDGSGSLIIDFHICCLYYYSRFTIYNPKP